MIINETKDYVVTNGLGKIVISKNLFKAIVNKILVDYPEYSYQDHKIKNLQDEYLEVSLFLKTSGKMEAKVIDHLQRELLLILKKSLSLNCILAININYGK